MIKGNDYKIFAVLLLSLIIIWFISKLIAYPLQKLAYYTESSTENNQDNSINNVRAWYYEAIHLKKSLVFSLNFFHDRLNYFIHQSTTDPLTKLTNRRTLDEQMIKWAESETLFSIILLDIDHFKRINDIYGHSTGDEVLIFLSDQIREVSRKNDLSYRFGGEEFLLLLPETDKNEAFQVAERLRRKMEGSISPCGEIVTISAGIATYPDSTTNLAELIEMADQCLYEAKSAGRNKCIVFNQWA